MSTLTEKVSARLSPFAATETILPFVLEHKQVENPALTAWNAAPSNPCGQNCLSPQLDVYTCAPPNAKAVVYVFHGGEGKAQMWITGEEEAALVGDLVRNTYAVVLLESTHRPVDANWFFPDPARFDPASFNHPQTPGSDDAWNATVNADEQLVRNVHAPAVLALAAGKRNGVKGQIKALRAEHHVSSQYHDRTVAFFDAHL